MGLVLSRWPILTLALMSLPVVADSGAAQAACYSSGQRLSGRYVAHFVADPPQLLSAHPQGGTQMISLVRDLVASDPATLPLLLDLTAKSNAQQINSIGAGLGQAALICSGTDPNFATEIRQMVAATSSELLTMALAIVIEDQPRRPGGGGVPGATASLGVIGPAGIASGQSEATGATRPSINSIVGSASTAQAVVTVPMGTVVVGTVSAGTNAGGSAGQPSSGSTTSENGPFGGSVVSQGLQAPVDMNSTNFVTLDTRNVRVNNTNSLSTSVSPSH
jgi:hypothetical protein